MWYDARGTTKKWHARYPEKANAAYKRWGKDWRAKNKTAYLKNRRRYYNQQLRYTRYFKLHGLTKEQYEALLKKQEYKCAICSTKAPLDVDHCHETNKVRGLLCRRCNLGIGYFGDKADVVQKAASYLK
jgi:DNA-directed RNA polymerase subunit RPC12/RpoP